MGRLWEIVGGKRKRTAAGIAHQKERWDSTSKYKKERAARNKARRKALAEGRVHKGDGNDIHDHNGKQQVISAHKNRGIREKSRRKGSSRNKARK